MTRSIALLQENLSRELIQTLSRFEVPGRMEYQEILVTRQQNREGAGYGSKGERTRERAVLRLFAEFYGLSHLPSWEEAEETPELCPLELRDKVFLQREVYTRRIQLSAETFLIEAESRGKNADRYARVHTVCAQLCPTLNFFPFQT